MKTNETIGVATLLNDGTLVLELRADGPATGDARFTYAPTDPHYAQVKRHLGDVQPGQTVAVKPFS